MERTDVREVVGRFFAELWNGRAFAVADEIVATDCVTHQLRSGDGPLPAEARGPAALTEHIASWVAAFPDILADVEAQVAEGDRVVSWVAMRGTHRGHWMGVPPTGWPVVIRCVTMHRVRDGRIVEDWVLTEALGFLQQLGLVAATPQLLEAAARRPAAPLGG